MANRIVVEASPRKPVPASLVGKEYLIKPPKAAIGLIVAQRAQAAGDDLSKLQPEIESLIVTMFGKKQAAAIQKRLLDPEDDLDYEHIFDLVGQVSEAASANPTS